MSVAFILLVILTIARLWIGLQLFLTARKSHLSNLYWLAGLFALAIYSIFTPLTGSPLGNPWIFSLGVIAGHFCLAMFIHTTFYRGRKSPIGIILGLLAVAFLADIYILSINDFNLANVIAGVGLINWIWHLIVAWSAYLAIAQDPSVEKWVKERYKLMIVYIILIALSSLQVVISNTSLASSLPAFFTPIGILLIIASIILQFLVWAMPEPFRLWLNRAEQIRPAQEQPRSVLDVFGDAMTTGTGLKTMVCFYAIRSAIGKEIGTEDSDAIRVRIKTMAYQDWEAVLQNPELHRILVNGGADKADADKAVENARHALVDKQSLLTLSTR